MSIMLQTLMGLAEESEREGVTLAEMISRRLSPGEMELASAEVECELACNYRSIEKFMSDVTVPSLEEIIGVEDGVAYELPVPEDFELSDGDIPEFEEFV